MNEYDFFQQHWQTFAQCPDHRSNLLREAQIATVMNSQPKTRTVILREVKAYHLIFHTDIRSEKVKSLLMNPNVAATCYDHQQKLQFNLQGVATLHHLDPLCEKRWDATKSFAKRCYLAPQAPGSISQQATANLPQHLLNRAPNDKEAQAGFAQFCVVQVQLFCCDILSLAHDGHKAARATFSKDTLDSVNWICP